jgi:hypothetical protein
LINRCRKFAQNLMLFLAVYITKSHEADTRLQINRLKKINTFTQLNEICTLTPKLC